MKVSNILLNVGSVTKSTKQYVEELCAELEEDVLACLAAGVPLNLISISKPYHHNQQNHHDSYQIKADLFFTGRL